MQALRFPFFLCAWAPIRRPCSQAFLAETVETEDKNHDDFHFMQMKGGSYNQGSYNQDFLQQQVLRPRVLTTRRLTTRTSYNKSYDQCFLQPGVLTTRGLTTRGSYNQGS